MRRRGGTVLNVAGVGCMTEKSHVENAEFFCACNISCALLMAYCSPFSMSEKAYFALSFPKIPIAPSMKALHKKPRHSPHLRISLNV